MREEFLWTEKYRPKTINDAIIQNEYKETFNKFIQSGNIPNMILAGPPGVGKTTLARAMLNEINADYIIINGSMDRNIDTLRNEIKNFCSTVSFSGSRKYVILDEADYLNPNSTQPALRNFIEEFSKNAGFIFTCNYLNKIIQPLHSRCSVIEFKIPKKDLPQIASKFFKRIEYILNEEGVKYDPKVVAELITKYVPDWRRVINELQRYSINGTIDAGILAANKNNLSDLIKLIKEKNFSEARKWIGENDVDNFFEELYAQSKQVFASNSLPQLILILAKYQYQAAFVASQEINIAACIVEIMADCELK